MKQCSRCHETKPFAEFSPMRAGSHGLHAYCRPCVNAYNSARRVKKRWWPETHKRCPRCMQIKMRTEFPLSMRRGNSKIISLCYPCSREYNRVRAQKNRRLRPEVYRASAKRAKRAEYLSGKYFSRMYVRCALYFGDLQKQPCEVCGEPKVQAHHEDYAKPLMVRWLCVQHHGLTLRKARPALALVKPISTPG